MIELRAGAPDDIESLVQIYESFYTDKFPLDFSNSFARVLASSGDKIIGFGWLELNVEATVILDLKAKQRDKFAALKAIIAHGERVAEQSGFKQVHVFPGDSKFTGILKKHLGFNDITGDCLVKNIQNGQER